MCIKNKFADKEYKVEQVKMIFFFRTLVDVINHVRGADGRRKELKNMEQSLLNNHVLIDRNVGSEVISVVKDK